MAAVIYYLSIIRYTHTIRYGSHLVGLGTYILLPSTVITSLPLRKQGRHESEEHNHKIRLRSQLWQVHTPRRGTAPSRSHIYYDDISAFRESEMAKQSLSFRGGMPYRSGEISLDEANTTSSTAFYATW